MKSKRSAGATKAWETRRKNAEPVAVLTSVAVRRPVVLQGMRKPQVLRSVAIRRPRA